MNTKEYVISIRRKLHENPELGFEEFETQKLIIKELESFGLSYSKFATGIMCDVGLGIDPDKFIAFRADIDALPIQEETCKIYASKVNGKMHACGHDCHTAILLGVVREISKIKDKINGKIRFIFQPNEEGTNGAKFMVDSGVLEPKPNAIFGLHVKPDLPVGTVGLKYDEMMAAVDEFKITLNGTGGHAALPNITQDVILASSEIVIALNTIVSRNISPTRPAVLSVCKFNAGTNFNVIPSGCTLVGTIRTFDNSTREIIHSRLNSIVENFAKANGIKFNVEINNMGEPLINTNSLVDLVRLSCEDTIGKGNIEILKEPCMGGEDFAEYLKIVDGCYFYLGVKNEAKNPVYDWHNPKFDIDEDALEVGVRVFYGIIKKMFSF